MELNNTAFLSQQIAGNQGRQQLAGQHSASLQKRDWRVMNQQQQVKKRGNKNQEEKSLAWVTVREGISSVTPHICAMEGKAVVEPGHLCMDGEEQKKGYVLVPSRWVKDIEGCYRVGSLEKSVGSRDREGQDVQQDSTAHCYVAQQGLGKVKRHKGRKFLPHLESLPVINSIQLVVSGS